MRLIYIDQATQLINTLYNTLDGGVGGYGHVVFDDMNTETHFVVGCLRDAYNKTYDEIMCEETRQASIKALEHFVLLTENERDEAIRRYHKLRFEKLF